VPTLRVAEYPRPDHVLLHLSDAHLIAGEERLYGELIATERLTGLERWPKISVEHIALAGDMHTLRPPSLQREAHRLVDELLQRELEQLAR